MKNKPNKEQIQIEEGTMKEACLEATKRLQALYPNYNIVFYDKFDLNSIIEKPNDGYGPFVNYLVPWGGVIMANNLDASIHVLAIVDQDPDLAIQEDKVINGIFAYNTYKAWLKNEGIFPVVYFYNGDYDLDFGNLFIIPRNKYHLHNEENQLSKAIGLTQTPSCFCHQSKWTKDEMIEVIYNMSLQSIDIIMKHTIK